MSEMVERVKEAIWAAQRLWESGDCTEEEKRDPGQLYARAAIEAMRNPTASVICAVEDRAEERYRAAPAMQRWYGEDVWNAGVDEALKD